MSPRSVSCKTTPRQATPAAPIKRLIRQPANGEMPARCRTSLWADGSVIESRSGRGIDVWLVYLQAPGLTSLAPLEMPDRGLGAPPLLRRGRTDRPETKPPWPTFAASSTIHKQIRPNSPVANVDLATRGPVKAEEAQPGRDQSQQHTDQATTGRGERAAW